MPRPRFAHLRHDSLRSTSRRALLLMLLAAATAPAVTTSGAIEGEWISDPFGLPPTPLRVLVVFAGFGYFAWRLRRESPRRAILALAGISILFYTLAMVFAIVVDTRSTMFYTDRALEDGMGVLLAIYAAGALLRALAQAGIGRTRRLSPSTWFADDLTTLAWGALIGFWVFSAFALYPPAALLLLLIGGSGVLALLLRLPDAFSVIVEAWSHRRPARPSHRTPVQPGGSS